MARFNERYIDIKSCNKFFTYFRIRYLHCIISFPSLCSIFAYNSIYHWIDVKLNEIQISKRNSYWSVEFRFRSSSMPKLTAIVTTEVEIYSQIRIVWFANLGMKRATADSHNGVTKSFSKQLCISSAFYGHESNSSKVRRSSVLSHIDSVCLPATAGLTQSFNSQLVVHALICAHFLLLYDK